MLLLVFQVLAKANSEFTAIVGVLARNYVSVHLDVGNGWDFDKIGFSQNMF
jgi:hypothetical protein